MKGKETTSKSRTAAAGYTLPTNFKK